MTEIYTDGSCIGNPGPGGWAFCILQNNEDYCMSDGVKKTTNNRMEMCAVIEALSCLKDIECIIYSDSKVVINCAQGKWKRKKNLDLWSKYDKISQGKSLTWVWVKGHSGNKYNDLVDSMAQIEARNLV